MIPIILTVFYGYSLSGSYSVGKLLAVVLTGLWLALGTVHRRDYWLPAAYLGALILSTILSADPWLSIWAIHGTNNIGLLCALSLVPFYACVSSEDRPRLERGLRWASFLMAAVGLAQWAGITWEWVLPFPLFTGDRVYSTIGSPVYCGAIAALCFPFLLTWLERGFLLAFLVATGSRGAWLAVGVGSLYLHWWRIPVRWRQAGIVALPSSLIALMLYRPPSDLGRVVMWHYAVNAFKARPWLGWGTGNFFMVTELQRGQLWSEIFSQTTADHAHNIFFEAASSGGMIGLVALCGLAYALWYGSDRVTRAALLGLFFVALLNPLPMIGKAIALMIAASCRAPAPTEKKSILFLVKGFALICFFAVFLQVHWDRMMTIYGEYPWSLSSVKAAAYSNLLKAEPDRKRLQL
jgi:hypothetical protein